MEAEFRSFKQGALSVTDYCRRLETMAASLMEFGDPIGDRQLVLTLLRGLNAKFRHMVSNLKMQRPFPTFAEARTLLLLEEIDIHDVIHDPCSEPKTSTQALVVQQPPRTPAAPGGFGAPSGAPVATATAGATAAVGVATTAATPAPTTRVLGNRDRAQACPYHHSATATVPVATAATTRPAPATTPAASGLPGPGGTPATVSTRHAPRSISSPRPGCI
jgi:hypothetical protein